MTDISSENLRYIKLEDGLAIYLPNKRSKTWNMRCRENGQEVRLSLKTRSVSEARGRAYAYKHNPEATGFNPVIASKRNFGKFHDEFETYIKRKFSINSQRGILRQYNRYFIEEFRGSDINNLSKDDLYDVIEKYELDKTVLRDFKMATNAVFEYLDDQNLIDRRPTFPKVVIEQDSYDAFSTAEINYLYDHMTNLLYGNNKHFKQKAIKPYIAESMLYFKLQIELGCRPGNELLLVKNEELESINDKYYITISNGKNSKRGGKRKLSIRSDLAFEMIWLKELSCDQMGKQYPPLFSNEVKHANDLFFDITYAQLRAVFEAALEDGIESGNVRKNKKFSMYSFRHSYITRSLQAGVDIYLLAKQTGSSVAMIEKNYSEMQAIDRDETILNLKSPFEQTETSDNSAEDDYIDVSDLFE